MGNKKGFFSLSNLCIILGVMLLVIAFAGFADASASNSPSLNVPSRTVSCTEDLNKMFYLPDYSSDSNVLALRYSIVSQSDTSLANCVIDNNTYISCRINSCRDSESEVVVRVDDSFGHYSQDFFTLSVRNFNPVWNPLPQICISDSNSRFVNLKDYINDREDGKNVTFSLIEQVNPTGLNCYLEDGNYLSCDVSSNRHLTSSMKIRAVDSRGKDANLLYSVSSNCFDSGANPSNGAERGFYLEAANYGICLERCNSFGTQMKLVNNTSSRRCFDFDAESTPYNLLNVSVTPGEVCAAANSTAYFTLNTNTCGAEERKYDIEVFALDTNLKTRISAEVGTCNNFDGFRILETDGKVCKGQSKEFTVMVRNTSSVQKKIRLLADNSMVLPYFTRDSVTLASGEQKEMKLVINAQYLDLGHQSITLLGDADDFHIQKRMDVEVVDCSSVVSRTFSLSVPSICYDVRRGQTLEGQFNISRPIIGNDDCYFNPKTFNFKLTGMPSELAYSSVTLNAGEGRAVNYTIKVPKEISAGKNYLTLSAVDGPEWDAYKESKTICVNVAPESKAGLFVNTQSKDITQGETEVFEVEAVNTGDLDSNYVISVIDTPGSVNVSLSENSFVIKKGESKKIYAAVSVGLAARVGSDKKVTLKLKGPVEVSASIYFNVLGKSFFDGLEILSSTNKVKMKGNSSATYSIVIRNNTEKDMKNVVVSFDNVPKDVNIDSVTIATLASGKSANISGKIKAGDTNGVFEPVFVISSADLINKKSFDLEIEYNPDKSGTGFFAGLFGLADLTLEAIFIGIVAAIILILFVGFIAVVAKASAGEAKEVWMH